jgi:large subunit ribosomal protein L9
MRVILQKEVHNLGDAGDIVSTSSGYARNFLLPRGLAIAASESSVASAEHHKRVAEATRRRELASARALADRVGATAITLRRETGDENRLFGSVTHRDIAEALSAEGIELDHRAIRLDDPIRSVGVHQVPIRLHREVTATIKVFVIKA